MDRTINNLLAILFLLGLTNCSQNPETTYWYCGRHSNLTEQVSVVNEGVIELLKFSSAENGFLIDSLRIQGGVQSFLSKIVYPQIALRAGIKGIAGATFTIDTLGNANNIKITKGIWSGCDEALLFAIKNQKFVYQSNFSDEFNETINLLVRFDILYRW